MNFTLKMCQELDPTSPSIYQVKHFQLPGLIPPTKVSSRLTRGIDDAFIVPIQCHSVKGIPYFVNYPSTILKKCLGIPEISKNLNRFPVCADGDIRYSINKIVR